MVTLTVGQLKEIVRMLDEGEPRMTDRSPVRVDFLNSEGTVMGPLAGVDVEAMYWSIDEQTLSLLILTEKRIEI